MFDLFIIHSHSDLLGLLVPNGGCGQVNSLLNLESGLMNK